MQVFVLGASGYIGRVLIEDLSTSINAPVLRAGRNVTECSVDLESRDFSGFQSCCERGDIVVLLSAISSPDVCAREREKAWRVNVDNTIHLITELTTKGVRVLFSSSDVVMGGNLGKSLDNSSLQPSGLYGEMKAEVERAVFSNELVKVVRFSLVVGRGDKFTEMLKCSARAGKVVNIFAGFERNIVSIDDVTEGICRLVHDWDKVPQRFFNFSGPELVSREKLTAALVAVIPNLKYTVTEAPDGFWDNRQRTIETGCDNFRLLLGRTPRALREIILEWRK